MRMAAAMNMMSGKLAVVTGAGSGIGLAVCKLLASRGTEVIAVDQNINSLTAIKQDVASVHKLDVSRKADIEDVYASVIDHYKAAPHILVNSAGITRDQFLLKMTEQEWDEVLRVNLKGSFLMSQIHAKQFLKHKQTAGSIVNVSSVVAKGNIGQVNYAASKAGVIGMTKTCALELARFGLRVNCVLPGFIDTPMTKAVPEKVLNNLTIPLQRTGKPEEVASLIAFLASDESSYITGAAINIDGGMKILTNDLLYNYVLGLTKRYELVAMKRCSIFATNGSCY